MIRMLPLKAVLLSSGVVSMTVMFIKSLPVILDFLTSELPLLWSLAISLLRPPYLYLLINCIIISIVASSKLKPRGDGGDRGGESFTPAPEKEKDPEVESVVAPVDAVEEDEVVFGYVESPVVNREEHHVFTPPPLKTEGDRGDDEEESERFDEGDEFVLSKLVWNSPEKVSRPNKQDTLESTWLTITEGRSMPLTRHLKKSDTFAGVSTEASPFKVMKKSDTFAGGSSSPASARLRLRREPSLSQDELNRRVEAFIKKFNEEMRLQRQDSLNQYKE